VIVPPARSRYLAEIADTVRGYHRAWRPEPAGARTPATARGAHAAAARGRRANEAGTPRAAR
jgi:methylmalonyl-CoA mutase